MRDKVATIVARFPRDTLPPVIQKIDPDAAPILTIVISGERSQKEITTIVDKQIKQVLETVKDVGEVLFLGERRREIQLLLNADRLNAYGLTVDQVRQAVQRQNVEVPGGSFIAGPTEIALRTMGRIHDTVDFNRIIIAYRDGSTITFGDIGRVLDTVEEVRGLSRLDGNPAVSLMIRKQSGTNTVTVVDAVMARLDRLKDNACRRTSEYRPPATSPALSAVRFRISSTTWCWVDSWPASWSSFSCGTSGPRSSPHWPSRRRLSGPSHL